MTGLEFIKAPGTTAGEIADIISQPCPPIVPAECDRLSCRECWLAWLTTGEPPKEKGRPMNRRPPTRKGSTPTSPITSAESGSYGKRRGLCSIISLVRFPPKDVSCHDGLGAFLVKHLEKLCSVKYPLLLKVFDESPVFRLQGQLVRHRYIGVSVPRIQSKVVHYINSIHNNHLLPGLAALPKL